MPWHLKCQRRNTTHTLLRTGGSSLTPHETATFTCQRGHRILRDTSNSGHRALRSYFFDVNQPYALPSYHPHISERPLKTYSVHYGRPTLTKSMTRLASCHFTKLTCVPTPYPTTGSSYTDPSTCCAACASRTGCKQWSHSLSTSTCYLKKGDSPNQFATDSSWVSGYSGAYQSKPQSQTTQPDEVPFSPFFLGYVLPSTWLNSVKQQYTSHGLRHT